MATQALTQAFTEQLNTQNDVMADIHAGDGNLQVDGTASPEALASGELQYPEKMGAPTRSVTSVNGKTSLTLKAGTGGGQRWLRLPWAACNGATTWQVHLNPTLPTDLFARSNGGNIHLNLAAMQITRVKIENGGGNVGVILPESAANLEVTASTGGGNVTVSVGGDTNGTNMVRAESGAGNVSVTIPAGIAVRVYATSGMGKVLMPSRINKVGDHVYESTGYDNAVNRVDMTLKSGAGNVSVNEVIL